MRLNRIAVAFTLTLLSGAPVLAQNGFASSALQPDTADYHVGHVNRDGQMQVGRYTTLAAASEAEAADPLQVQAHLRFPRQTVRTVGDALRHALLRSGWSLVEVSALAPEAQRLLGLALPESQRTSGPYRLRTILQVLTGPSWRWHEDALQRLVWFEPIRVRDAYADALPASEPLDRVTPHAVAVASPVPSAVLEPASRVEPAAPEQQAAAPHTRDSFGPPAAGESNARPASNR